jgi:hypothetical protein
VKPAVKAEPDPKTQPTKPAPTKPAPVSRPEARPEAPTKSQSLTKPEQRTGKGLDF